MLLLVTHLKNTPEKKPAHKGAAHALLSRYTLYTGDLVHAKAEA